MPHTVLVFPWAGVGRAMLVSGKALTLICGMRSFTLSVELFTSPKMLRDFRVVMWANSPTDAAGI